MHCHSSQCDLPCFRELRCVISGAVLRKISPLSIALPLGKCKQFRQCLQNLHNFFAYYPERFPITILRSGVDSYDKNSIDYRCIPRHWRSDRTPARRRRLLRRRNLLPQPGGDGGACTHYRHSPHPDRPLRPRTDPAAGAACAGTAGTRGRSGQQRRLFLHRPLPVHAAGAHPRAVRRQSHCRGIPFPSFASPYNMCSVPM